MPSTYLTGNNEDLYKTHNTLSMAVPIQTTYMDSSTQTTE